MLGARTVLSINLAICRGQHAYIATWCAKATVYGWLGDNVHSASESGSLLESSTGGSCSFVISLRFTARELYGYRIQDDR